jgi:hypothetical protein
MLVVPHAYWRFRIRGALRFLDNSRFDLKVAQPQGHRIDRFAGGHDIRDRLLDVTPPRRHPGYRNPQESQVASTFTPSSYDFPSKPLTVPVTSVLG